MDKVHIAIITFKQPFLLERLLTALSRFGWPPCKVSVFEDYPIKRWPNEQDEHRITDIKVAYQLVASKFNVPLHEAHEWQCCHKMATWAMEECSESEWVMLLSDDVLPTPGCIHSLLSFLNKHELKDVAAIQIPYWNVDDLLAYHPELLRSRMHAWWDMDVLHRVPENPWWSNDCFLYTWDGTQPRTAPSPYATVHATGFLLRSSVWREVGGFDTRLCVYDEDISVKIWLRTEMVVIKVPGPPLVHIHGTATYSGFPEDTIAKYDGQALKAQCWGNAEMPTWMEVFEACIKKREERSAKWRLE